jgi:predicted site-specific integrase-resolvase
VAKTYSTQEAAKLIGVDWTTLHRWLRAKRVRPSIAVPMGGGRTLWRWTVNDVKQVRAFKAANYRKGRGRKKAT